MAIGTGTWIFVRDYPHEKGYRDLTTAGGAKAETAETGVVEGIVQVFGYRNTGLLFIIPGGNCGLRAHLFRAVGRALSDHPAWAAHLPPLPP
jgi:hypothetical protein